MGVGSGHDRADNASASFIERMIKSFPVLLNLIAPFELSVTMIGKILQDFLESLNDVPVMCFPIDPGWYGHDVGSATCYPEDPIRKAVCVFDGTEAPKQFWLGDVSDHRYMGTGGFRGRDFAFDEALGFSIPGVPKCA